MLVKPTIKPVPINTVAAINKTNNSIVFIPDDWDRIEELAECEGHMIEADDDTYDQLKRLGLIDINGGEAQGYFANRCVAAQHWMNTDLSREAYAAIFESMLADNTPITDIILSIRTIIRQHYEMKVDDLLRDADLQVAGLSDGEKTGLAMGVLLYEYDMNYISHYSVDNDIYLLYTER